MASVPNMRGFQLAPPAAAPACGDGDFSKQFPGAKPAAIVQPVVMLPPEGTAPPVDPATRLSPDVPELTTGLPAPDADTGESADAPEPKDDPDAALVSPIVALLPIVVAQIVAPVTVTIPAPVPAVDAPEVRLSPDTPAATTGLPIPDAAAAEAAVVGDAPAPKAANPRTKAQVAKAPAPVPAPAIEIRDSSAVWSTAAEPAGEAAVSSSAAAPATPLPIAPALVSPLVALAAPVPAATTKPADDKAVAAGPATTGANAPDQTVERALDLARDGQWLDRLARDIVRAGANEGPLRFRLHPASLGHLQVELAQGDHGTSIRLTVETEQARTILTDAQPRLIAEARAQGVRVAGAEVDLAGSGRDQASSDPRRQADGSHIPFVRTARAAARPEALAAAADGRRRSDRYA
jgi:flagellar hook-length control protein FliK